MDLMAILIVVVVIGVIAQVAWWIFLAYVAYNAVRLAVRGFENEAAKALQLANRMQSLPPAKRAGDLAHLNVLLTNVSTHWNHMDRLVQQRHDLVVGDLMSKASSVGLPWRP